MQSYLRLLCKPFHVSLRRDIKHQVHCFVLFCFPSKHFFSENGGWCLCHSIPGEKNFKVENKERKEVDEVHVVLTAKNYVCSHHHSGPWVWFYRLLRLQKHPLESIYTLTNQKGTSSIDRRKGKLLPFVIFCSFVNLFPLHKCYVGSQLDLRKKSLRYISQRVA